jgi:hypothetical protein
MIWHVCWPHVTIILPCWYCWRWNLLCFFFKSWHKKIKTCNLYPSVCRIHLELIPVPNSSVMLCAQKANHRPNLTNSRWFIYRTS